MLRKKTMFSKSNNDKSIENGFISIFKKKRFILLTKNYYYSQIMMNLKINSSREMDGHEKRIIFSPNYDRRS